MKPRTGLSSAYQFTKGISLQILRIWQRFSKSWPGLSYFGSDYRVQKSSTDVRCQPGYRIQIIIQITEIEAKGHVWHLNMAQSLIERNWEFCEISSSFIIRFVAAYYSGASKCININRYRYLGRKIEDERMISCLFIPNAAEQRYRNKWSRKKRRGKQIQNENMKHTFVVRCFWSLQQNLLLVVYWTLNIFLEGLVAIIIKVQAFNCDCCNKSY